MGCLMSTKYETYKITTTKKVHYLWSPLIVLLGILIYYLATLSFYNLPNGLYKSEENEHPNCFIAERAYNTLRQFVELGPKVVGSSTNEQLTIKFLIDNIRKIQRNASNLYKIEYDVQIASGGYMLGIMANMYQTIQNVVVKFSPINSDSNSSLLINSHFDTVPTSPGAGDDGTMVVVMLEILNILSKSTTPLRHSIVFLFNGAEENPLQGSHAFITQHKWTENIKAFINLDSAGNGGKEVLFQSGPNHPWLMSYYRSSVPHPYASTLAEELFQGNLVPSDTDFRIFRDYGNIPGLDLAHSYNGFVYHTKYDQIDTISIGTLQHTGDNILELTKALANAPELENPQDHAVGHVIFFDFLGLFLVFYTEIQGIIINVTISIVALIAICISLRLMGSEERVSWKNVLSSFGLIFISQIIAICLGIGLTVLFGVVIDAAGLSLFWYSQHWLIFGVYFCPLLFGLSILPALYLNFKNYNSLSLSYRIQMFLHSQCVILVILIIILSCLYIRSTFLLTISVLFYTIGLLCNLICRFHSRPFLWMAPHLIGQIIPILFYCYMAHITFTTFIPMQGRGGSVKNPEILICIFTIVFGILIGSFVAPMFSICRKSKTVLCGLLLVTIAFVVIIVTPIGFPYKERTSPQRHWIFHSHRVFHNFNETIRKDESGYFILPMDRHTVNDVRDIAINMSLARSTKEDCLTELFCGLPLYSMSNLAHLSYWIPAERPELLHEPTLNLLTKDYFGGKTVRYTFKASGPDHMSIFIRSLEDTKLVDWSFLPFNETSKSKEYFVYFSYAIDSSPYQFYLDVETSKQLNEPNIEIALVGHLTHFRYGHTPEFKKFLKSFPPWTHITAWRSSYESWIY